MPFPMNRSTDPLPSEGRRSPGRPSLGADRRKQVINAFITLIADRGLEGVTLDDVAQGSGVQRSVIRHYVGNRRDLVTAAVEALIDRYEAGIREVLGSAPSAAALLEFFFGQAWVSSSVEDRAFTVLLQEATRDDATRQRLQHAYLLLTENLATAIRREHPDTDPDPAEDAAYQIVCLAEHNATMQQLGFPQARSVAAHDLAVQIIDALDP